MRTANTRAERIGIRLYVFPPSKSSQTAYVVLQPALIAHEFTVSIIGDQSLKEDRLQLVSPPRSEHDRPPFICRPPQGAASDPHDVRTVETASVLSKSEGGLITMPESDPKQFSVFVDFLSGEDTTLADFCERSSSLRKCKATPRKIGTEEPQSVRQRNHTQNQCATSTLGLDHVHVIALGAFSPDDPLAHDNALPPVLSSPFAPTPLLPLTSPPDHSLILELNVTSVASDVGNLTDSPTRCALIFLRAFKVEHLSKLGPPSSLAPPLLSKSPSCQHSGTAFGVEGPGTSPGTVAPQYTLMCECSHWSGYPPHGGKLGVPSKDAIPGVEKLAGALEIGSR